MEEQKTSRGLNGPNKQEDIKIFLHQQQARLVGFLETKVKTQNMAQVMGKHWDHNATLTDRGRIIVSWHLKRYKFIVIKKNDQMIHGEAIQLATNKRFYITFVYGKNLEEQRQPFGDGEIRDFVDCILQIGLHEFNYVGAVFTWTNRTIWSRIGRALYNDLWHGTFVFTHVNFMTEGLSNHTPITLSFPYCPEPKHSFIFYDMGNLRILSSTTLNKTCQTLS
ncbi:hypothetical protein Cgig2_009194 [Carnegiea gigantea]|uniref:Uncharacterized protein n=1 Tax=Carnegiea gigantea TaxID=171969 RepID=A0A9Q1JIT6_9CARY|nr:hypothetical protein Cgig2_009194 [Carnegiea gigantea]